MRFLFAVLFSLFAFTAAAQPAGIMPQRVRIVPANATELSLYMLLSRRADRVLWSPGGSLLAVADSTDVDLYSVADLLLAPRRIRVEQALTDFAFSPDGRVIYTLIPGSLVSWSTTDSSIQDRFVADARRIAISPNGEFIALLARRNVVQIISVATRETFTVSPSITPDDIVFSTDGRRLFVSDGAGGGEVIDLALRQSERLLTGIGTTLSAGLLNSAAYSSDGRHILSQTSDDASAFLIWNARTSVDPALVSRPAEYQRVYGWGINTRSGLLVGAAVGMSPEQSALLVWPLSGGDPLMRLRHPGVRDAQLSPDGTLIASVGGGTLRLWALSQSLPLPEQASALTQVNVVAACDIFGVPPALGELLDGQTVSLVWSWFATTPRLVRDYLDSAQYRLDLDGLTIRPWIVVSQTLPDAANGGNPTVYLYAPVGSLSRGSHLAQVSVTWVQPINDGYADFGPGTATVSDGGTCSFTVR